MNSKQFELQESILDAVRDVSNYLTVYTENRIEYLIECLIKSERTRIKSELKKLDVSRYSAMSLMVKVMDIIGGRE